MRRLGGPSREQMLGDARRYDNAVDVVSAFHWLYSGTKDLPATVDWFERYPRLAHSDGEPATPDFCVTFRDGSALAAEIAWLSLQESSVDSVCRQLARYETLTAMPTATGETPVNRVDVMLLVPLHVGQDALRRVIDERVRNESHPYKPNRAPCVVQFALSEGKYVFQRLGHPYNGTLDAEVRTPALGGWLQHGQLNTPVDQFRGNKAQYAFINDPIDPLYLASHLWVHVLPSLTEVDRSRAYTSIDLTTAEIADHLRHLYGTGRTKDVTKAMDVLSAAGYAEPAGPGRWRVAWGEVRLRPGEADLAEAFASRATDADFGGGLIHRRRRAEQASEPNPQPTLFDGA